MTETMFYILLSLQKERHGYEIMQYVQTITKGRITLGAGTVYQSLSKLRGDKLITPTQEIDRQKKYVITSLGVEVLKLEAARLEELFTNSQELFQL